MRIRRAAALAAGLVLLAACSDVTTTQGSGSPPPTPRLPAGWHTRANVVWNGEMDLIGGRPIRLMAGQCIC